MLCTQIVFCFCFDIQNMWCSQFVFCFCFHIQNNLCTQHVLSLEFPCTELAIQWTIFCRIVGKLMHEQGLLKKIYLYLHLCSKKPDLLLSGTPFKANKHAWPRHRYVSKSIILMFLKWIYLITWDSMILENFS